jgi:hypothetical protein
LFIPLPVQKVNFSSPRTQKYSIHNEKCLLLTSRKTAEHCRSFIELRTEQVLGRRYTACCVRERHGDDVKSGEGEEKQADAPASITALYAVLFDAEAYGREFWRQTGLGVSSPFAEWTCYYQPADNHANGEG